MTIWRMCIACWIIKGTVAHTSCVILIAFPLRQWLNERASVLLLFSWASVTSHGCTTA
jgi:hypothetical protein